VTMTEQPTAFDQTMMDMGAKERQLQEAKEKMAGSVPLISDPQSCVVILPRGILRGQEWEQEAEVRELNGADEEALARVRDVVNFFDHVLAHGVVRVGSEDLSGRSVPERLTVLQNLLLGERSQLLLAIIRVTYGDNKTLNVTCPNCEAEQEIDLILSEDFKSSEMETPHKLTYSYATSKGQSIEYRLVTGADQAIALSKKGATTAEQNSTILSRVITAVDGGFVVDPLKFVRDLSMRDRTVLLDKLTEMQPQIDLTLKVPCAGCGGEQVLALGWPDLFRP
jgi:ribosomal protein S27E